MSKIIDDIMSERKYREKQIKGLYIDLNKYIDFNTTAVDGREGEAIAKKLELEKYISNYNQVLLIIPEQLNHIDRYFFYRLFEHIKNIISKQQLINMINFKYNGKYYNHMEIQELFKSILSILYPRRSYDVLFPKPKK